MPICDHCGKEIALPYKCAYCGGSFCSKHRLPENHNCEGLERISEESRKKGRVYRGIDESLRKGPHREEPVGEEQRRWGPDISPSGLFGGLFSIFKRFFLKRATIIIILIMLSVYVVQAVVQVAFGGSYYHPRDPYPSADFGTFLYYLAPSRSTFITRPWTIVTGIFAHGGFFHLFVNGLVLFFIGSVLERRIGRNRFVYLFLTAGILSSIAQVFVIPNETWVGLGASGAIFGVLGALTALAPRMPIFLFFILPMPLWMLTLVYGSFEAVMALTGAGGNVGHMAHFTGLIIGLVYGYKLRIEMERRQRSLERIFGRYHW